MASSCDAFLVSSPEYHGTMSGVMKNTFDWVYENHVGGKVFGLMSTLGGISNSTHSIICESCSVGFMEILYRNNLLLVM